MHIGDNLQEMSNPVFWEKLEKFHEFVLCCAQRVVKVNLFVCVEVLQPSQLIKGHDVRGQFT